MTKRKLDAFGLNPNLGLFLLPLVFVMLSYYLFYKSGLAAYIYIFIVIALVSQLSEPKRNEFLKSIFSRINYLKVRMLENFVCALPFMLFLMFKQQYIFTLSIFLVTLIMALFNYNASLNFTIPTPFYKKPFEFAVGFRKTFFLFPLAYFLTFMAVSVSNYNLGIFSLLLLGVICLSYYSKPENEFYVWSFNLSPSEFLLQKIKTSAIYFTLLSLPIVLAISIFFLNEIGITLIFFGICQAFLVTIILAKYSAFPYEMSLPQGIIITISIVFPPILIVVIPYFYNQSIKRLNTILE